jgi:hypothetical protein
VEHTQTHLALKKVQKISITLAILVDMKVKVYFNFSKNRIWKKMKSRSSMRNGRFNKNGGAVNTHPFKKPKPLLHARTF